MASAAEKALALVSGAADQEGRLSACATLGKLIGSGDTSARSRQSYKAILECLASAADPAAEDRVKEILNPIVAVLHDTETEAWVQRGFVMKDLAPAISTPETAQMALTALITVATQASTAERTASQSARNPNEKRPAIESAIAISKKNPAVCGSIVAEQLAADPSQHQLQVLQTIASDAALKGLTEFQRPILSLQCSKVVAESCEDRESRWNAVKALGEVGEDALFTECANSLSSANQERRAFLFQVAASCATAKSSTAPFLNLLPTLLEESDSDAGLRLATLKASCVLAQRSKGEEMQTTADVVVKHLLSLEKEDAGFKTAELVYVECLLSLALSLAASSQVTAKDQEDKLSPRLLRQWLLDLQTATESLQKALRLLKRNSKDEATEATRKAIRQRFAVVDSAKELVERLLQHANGEAVSASKRPLSWLAATGAHQQQHQRAEGGHRGFKRGRR